LLPPNGTYPSGTTACPWMTARIGNAVWLMIIQPGEQDLIVQVPQVKLELVKNNLILEV